MSRRNDTERHGVTDWMTIRVVLHGGRGADLDFPPGRVLLAHADHAYQELAEAIDVAFGRWDLNPEHVFEVEGRRLVPSGATDSLVDGADAEDSEEVTIGEVGLRLGARFTYVFDPVHRWLHECTVFSVDVDPFDLYGEEPDRPVPILGWGSLPDQYGRIGEDDDPDAEEEDDETEWLDEDDQDLLDATDELTSWQDSEAGSWEIVQEALAEVARSRPDDDLSAAAQRLRSGPDAEDWRTGVLWAAAGFETEEPPSDDEEFWVELAAGVVSPRDPVPLDADRESAWAALEPADWTGAVVELVRRGVGQPAGAETILGLVVACPEVDNEDLTDEDEEILLAGFATVVELWQALGAVDDDERLTALGQWGLPEALQLAWQAP